MSDVAQLIVAAISGLLGGALFDHFVVQPRFMRASGPGAHAGDRVQLGVDPEIVAAHAADWYIRHNRVDRARERWRRGFWGISAAFLIVGCFAIYPYLDPALNPSNSNSLQDSFEGLPSATNSIASRIAMPNLVDYAAALSAKDCTPSMPDNVIIRQLACTMSEGLDVYIIEYANQDKRAERSPDHLKNVKNDVSMDSVSTPRLWSRADGSHGSYVTYRQTTRSSYDGKLWLVDDGNDSVAVVIFGRWDGPTLQQSWDPLLKALSAHGYVLD